MKISGDKLIIKSEIKKMIYANFETINCNACSKRFEMLTPHDIDFICDNCNRLNIVINDHRKKSPELTRKLN